ncbi:MAG TPA: hypothetical protein VLH77_00925 [Gammaproteobacteria bacterium]|nr:hypothetical protein [Gammaproteobacteria bacterium]
MADQTNPVFRAQFLGEVLHVQYKEDNDIDNFALDKKNIKLAVSARSWAVLYLGITLAKTAAELVSYVATLAINKSINAFVPTKYATTARNFVGIQLTSHDFYRGTLFAQLISAKYCALFAINPAWAFTEQLAKKELGVTAKYIGTEYKVGEAPDFRLSSNYYKPFSGPWLIRA